MAKASFRIRYRLGASSLGSVLAFLLGLFVGPAYLFATNDPPIAAIFLAMALPILLYALYTYAFALAVELADDGVVWKRRLGRKHFVPFAAIRAARADGDHLVLAMTDGSERRFRGNARPMGTRVDEQDVEYRPAEWVATAIAEELRNAAHAAHAATSLHAEARAALAGETTEGGYRAAAPTPIDALQRILEDAHADEKERAAAAVLLRVRAPEQARLRIAPLKDAIASPQLLAVIDAATSDEAAADAMAEALARVEGAPR